ncbi:MAG: cell division protein FtsX [Caulobacteraceae bacterium]
MKNIFYNFGYFLQESKTMLRLNLISNILSVLCTSLIFLILAMVVSGWWISNRTVQTIQGEAEISAYFDESMGNDGAMQLAEKIRNIKGVREVRLVNEEEAYDRMVDILGKEARVLEFFDDNPFSPFIEVKISLENIDSILGKLGDMPGIDHVRDNREILNRLRNIADVLQFSGYLVVIAVAVSTVVIISHIIRLGIYSNKEQIDTLRLLGAPESFIAFPFLLEGLLLTLGGGIFASVLAAFSLKYIYAQIAGPLPFIPLPPIETLIAHMVILVISLSAAIGVAGSLMGLSSARKS